MDVGRVKWFSESQGYGFIEHIDGREVYFHYTAVVKNRYQPRLTDGVEVEFDLLTTTSGYEASNVRVFER
ncbi:MAG: cold shock domain-containing protein [Bdellovibrionales bacterium]|nr:cold shock domain-containing protein [Bdellovibrionales bacterium]